MNWCIDTGAINALSVQLDPPLTMYREGLPLRVLVKNNNTGSTTINVNSLGNRPVVRANGAQLEANDLRAGMIALLVDDGSKFQMVNFQGILASSNNNYFVDIPYAEDTDATPNGITGIYTPAITAPTSGDLVLIKINGRNTGPVMFKVNALAPVPIIRTDGQFLQAFDLDHNEILLLVYNVDRWQCLRLVRSQVMFKLNANLILYVRTDGDDVNGDGSVNDAAHAFKTPQRAVDFIKQSFLIAGRTVTIQFGIPGTYGPALVTNIPGRLIFKGDMANVSGYVMRGLTTPDVTARHGQVLVASGAGIDVTAQGITFSVTDAQSHFVECDYGAFLTIDTCNFSGVPTNGACISCTAAQVSVLNILHMYSNCYAVLYASDRASIISGAWYTNFYVHGISFTGFAVSAIGAVISLYYAYVNWTGGGFGYRYIVQVNAVIYTNSGGIQWLPGNQPGVADASSVYV